MPDKGELKGNHKCDVCGRIAHDAWNNCRFEIGCSCWRGIPCKGKK